MAEWKYACKTAQGMNLDLKLFSRGLILELTKSMSGAGRTSPTQLMRLQDIIDPVQELEILDAVERLEENVIRLPVILKNKGVIEKYDMHQLGIYAEDPDVGEILYIVLQSDSAEEIPSYEEMKDFTLEWYLNLSMENTQEVTVVINETGVLTTEQADARYVSSTGEASETTVTFEEAEKRANIGSKESLSIIFGKIKKWLSDLKTVAFTGSYNDLTNKPSIPMAVRVKGNAETAYRDGDVNITPENIGLENVDNTADKDKNVATATRLSTARNIFGQSFNGTADIAGKGKFYGNYNSESSQRYHNSALEIRENEMVGNAQSDNGGYAPTIGFHWANRCAAMISLFSDGVFHFLKQDGTTRATIDANLRGNADSATKATQDGSGNVIKDSYAVRKIVTGGDFNDMTIPGLYTMKSNSLNAPTDGGWHSLIVLCSDTEDYIHQIAIQESTTYAYVRYKYSTWSDWKRLLREGDTVANATNASTATKATKDGNGNNIVNTYWNKDRDIITTRTLTLNQMTLSGNYDGYTSGTVSTLANYKPIFAVARASNTSDVAWMSCYLNGTTVHAGLKNTSSVSKTFSPDVTVVYLRTS